jgi:hypothetical protein
MRYADLPARFPIPFANNAGGGFIRSVPEASQIGVQDGAASLFDGFPPLCFTGQSLGGFLPFGDDFNGILKQITQWSQWQQAGALVDYDATYSSDVSGYPKGAVLVSASNTGECFYNLVDGNTNDPDTAPTNWVPFTPLNLYAEDTGTANASAIALVPAPASLGFLFGREIRIKKIGSTNTAAMTLNVNGFGAAPITHTDGSSILAGEVPASGIFTVSWDGSQFQLLTPGSIVESSLTFSSPYPSVSLKGYITVPTPVGNMVLQWMAGGTIDGWDPQSPKNMNYSLDWLSPFSSACLIAWASCEVQGASTAFAQELYWYNISSFSASACQISRCGVDAPHALGTLTRPWVVGIGF